MSADKSQSPEQGLLALQAEQRAIADNPLTFQILRAAARYFADSLTPHIAAQQALTAERDALRAAGEQAERTLKGIANMAHRAWESLETIEEICKQIEISALAALNNLCIARADAT